MKKWKLALSVTAAFVLLVFCVGCSGRSPTTAEEFKGQAEAAGFTVQESTDSGAQRCLTAVTQNGAEMIYLQFTDTEQAVQLFENLKANLESTGENKGKTLDSPALRRYEAQNGEIREHLIQMQSTFLYAKYSLSESEPVEKVLKSLHY